ncbi:hypothetical protein ACJMK2_035770 [Sinanodonta woodiana]|uniref:3-hydroxyanthranilate 3,4-dioxygenase n=1 Tax=Sinanodonta woodiana TaxID=1069815 RepID=A0ABD3WFA2_SINWO
MALTDPIITNIDEWLKENSQYFLPPVCNKMMHMDGQIKSFFVGGPNQRKDYHIEEGEELFYMLKGDMCLKIIEKGKFKDVTIKEGEIFLLPACIAHSPQREAGTIGLVIERERAGEELDGLRYFMAEDGKPILDSLYEEWFHCEDLGQQLGPVIKRFFASEQFKTGKPIPGTIPENPPIKLNFSISIPDPFNLHDWIENNREKINLKGFLKLFTDLDNYKYQFQVFVYGKGENTGKSDVAETFIWQLEGTSTITTNSKDYTLNTGHNMLIRVGQEYTARRSEGSVALICYQDPTLKQKVI